MQYRLLLTRESCYYFLEEEFRYFWLAFLELCLCKNVEHRVLGARFHEQFQRERKTREKMLLAERCWARFAEGWDAFIIGKLKKGNLFIIKN